MITDRDMSMATHIERFSFATIEQISKIFFKEQQYRYNLARRRLIRLKEAGYIKIFRDIATNRNIYVWNDAKSKIPSLQRLKILDIYAEMLYNGFNIEHFEVEKFWCDGKIRSDVFTIFVVKNRRYHFFIEVQLSNHHHNLEKYDKLYETGEVQKYLQKDFFPRVLLVSNTNYSNIELKHTSVVQLNTNLDLFATILF